MKKQYSSVEEFAQDKLREVDAENRNEELQRARKMTQMLLAYRGVQQGVWREDTFIPFDVSSLTDSKERAVVSTDNVFRPMVRALTKEASRSRTTISTQPRRRTRKTKSAARYASKRGAKFTDDIQNELFRQQEFKYLLLCGNVFRYNTVCDSRYGTRKVKRPITSVRKIGEGEVECTECAHRVKAELKRPTACPECGTGQMKSVQVEEVETIDGFREEQVPEFETILADPRSVKVPLIPSPSGAQMKRHSYLRWRTVEDYFAVKAKYPDKDILPGIEHDVTQLIVASGLSNGATEYNNFWGDGGGFDGNSRCQKSCLWLKPERYSDCLVGGKDFTEMFPNGIYLQMHGTSNVLTDFYGQDLADRWTHYVFDVIPDCSYGDGLDDALADQMVINELTGVQLEQALYNSFAKVILNGKVVDPSLMQNDSTIVPMNENVNTDIRPADSFAVIDPPKLSDDVYALRSQKEQSMRAKTAAYAPLTGESDPDTTTATESSILRDSAVATVGLALALRSNCDVEWMGQLLKMTQENWTPEVDEKILGDYSIEEARAFADCNLDEDLEFVVGVNSWIPRTEEQLRADFLNWMTAGGAIPGGFSNPQLPLEIQKAAFDLYRPPVELSQVQPDVRIVESRLNKLMAVSELMTDSFPSEDVLNEISDPNEVRELEAEMQKVSMALAAKIPVRPRVDNHEVFIREYTAFLKTDEGIFAHPIVQDAVEILIERHVDAARSMVAEEGQANAQIGGAEAQATIDSMPKEMKQAMQQQSQQGQPTAVSPTVPDKAGDVSPTPV